MCVPSLLSSPAAVAYSIVSRSAYWSSTAWTSFVASNTQGTTNYILSEISVFNAYFPGGLDDTNIKFRAVQWIVSEGFLVVAIASNLLSRAFSLFFLLRNHTNLSSPIARHYAWVFKASAAIIAIDLVLTVIWLPVGVSQTYGFQSAKWVFTERVNGSGASEGWNWCLAFLATSGVLTGWDASGHIAFVLSSLSSLIIELD